MQEAPTWTGLSIRKITDRFMELHLMDYERKITPHWIGQIVRRKLGLKTEKRHGSYVIADSEGHKLDRLYEKYGIAAESGDLGDSGDSAHGIKDLTEPPLPLIP